MERDKDAAEARATAAAAAQVDLQQQLDAALARVKELEGGCVFDVSGKSNVDVHQGIDKQLDWGPGTHLEVSGIRVCAKALQQG